MSKSHTPPAFTPEWIAEQRKAIKIAEIEANAICHGTKKITVSIPVQDSDSDIVIMNGLLAGEEALAEIERLRVDLQSKEIIIDARQEQINRLAESGIKQLDELEKLRATVANLSRGIDAAVRAAAQAERERDAAVAVCEAAARMMDENAKKPTLDVLDWLFGYYTTIKELVDAWQKARPA